MKKLMLGLSGLLVSLAGPAFSADLPVKAPQLRPQPAFSWTGCYAGGHAGGLWSSKSWTLAAPDPVVALGSHEPDSWTAGFQAGCDYQFDRFVLGIQGAYGWTDATGSHLDVIDGTTDRTRLRAIASVTGRLGYALDRWLPYMKGGVAWADDRYDRVDIGTTVIDGLAKETRSGWTAGVGAEYAFTNYLSGFVEYNHYDFGTRTLTFLDLAGAFDDNITIRQRVDTVKVGLNFRWWGWR